MRMLNACCRDGIVASISESNFAVHHTHFLLTMFLFRSYHQIGADGNARIYGEISKEGELGCTPWVRHDN